MPWAPGGDPYQPTDFGYDNWNAHLAPGFRAALQNIYGRGLDIGSEAPWQVVDQAFPRAGSAQLRQTHDQDLLDAARMFMSGQTPQKPGMVTPPPYWLDDPSQSSGGIDASSQTIGMSPAVGAISGYTGPATSIFGSVLGAGLPSAPAMALSALGALTSGKAFGMSLPGNPITETINNRMQEAFPLSGKTAEGKMESMVPVSPSFFNTAFTTPEGLQAAIVSALGKGNAVSDNALEAGVTPSQTQADAISSALQALAQGLPTVSPGSGMNLGTSPGQASQHGNEAFSGQGLSPKGTTYGDTPSLKGDGGKLGLDTPDPDQNFDFDPSTNADGTGTGTGTGAGVAGGAAPGGSSGGTSTSGSGDAFKKGGLVHDTHKGFARKKGSHVVPIDAHEGEFVLNANATKAARPQLEALNKLIPGDAKREDIAALVDRAANFFNVA